MAACWSGTVFLLLTVNVLITTAADDIFIFMRIFSVKIRIDISCELSAKQTIHMKCQSLFCLVLSRQFSHEMPSHIFSEKNIIMIKIKRISSATVLLSALRAE